MQSSHKQICKGYKPKLDESSPFMHTIGGVHTLDGGCCPSCKNDLILHSSLDTDDQRLNLYNKDFKKLNLLYCMRCELSWYDFQYHIISDYEIKVLRFNEGEEVEEWEEEVGLESFPQRTFDLEEVPEVIQELYNKLNRGETISEQEKLLICQFTNSFADEDVGGYPVVDVSNQIGGRAFLSQGLDDPQCSVCGKDMPFLASLTNDEVNELKFSFDSVQIVFFYCLSCKVVHVQHSM